GPHERVPDADSLVEHRIKLVAADRSYKVILPINEKADGGRFFRVECEVPRLNGVNPTYPQRRRGTLNPAPLVELNCIADHRSTSQVGKNAPGCKLHPAKRPRNHTRKKTIPVTWNRTSRPKLVQYPVRNHPSRATNATKSLSVRMPT